MSKLLKSCSLVLGSHPWFSYSFSQAAEVTALPDHPEHIGSSSPGTDKGAVSPVKSAGFRKKFAS